MPFSCWRTCPAAEARKGRPILNTAREALALLEADGLDGVLIEDVLVTRKAAR